MTGHGRGEAAHEGSQVAVELASVNRKQLEIAVNLPRELEGLETKVRELIGKQVSRGRVSARITLGSGVDSVEGQVQLNAPLAKAYAAKLHDLAKDLNIQHTLTLETLVRCPGVLQAGGDEKNPEDYWPVIETALNNALTEFNQMRAREGEHLAADLNERVQIVREALARVSEQAPEVSKRYHEQLQDRLNKAGFETELDEDRILREVALFADRSDITEEITRLHSHFKQFEGFAASDKPVGRTLDFLAQEMNREVNTIGSKANDSLISKEVVTIKAELEKFREQVQNVE